MNKRTKKITAMLAAAVFVMGTLTVQAEGTADSVETMETMAAKDVDLSDFSMPEFEDHTHEMQIDVETNLITDTENEILHISERMNQRAAGVLPDNPRAVVAGELTEDDNMDMYFFSATASKFMIAQLSSENVNYEVRLYIVDYETGDITPTNICGTAGNLIGINGLPADDYVFVVYANDGTAGDAYTLKINAANPSGSIASTVKITNDFRLILRYTNGDIYGDGTYIYNISKMNQENAQMEWTRNEDFSWGSGYIHRSHDVYNVNIKEVVGPASYSSSYATSDNVMLVYCDVDTGFAYMESAYQSGPDHEYERSFVDTFGKMTPRSLTADDFETFSHILVYDLNTGKAIDFYSPLNYYYACGAEGAPAVTFYQ